jgi:hypothetical protein
MASIIVAGASLALTSVVLAGALNAKPPVELSRAQSMVNTQYPLGTLKGIAGHPGGSEVLYTPEAEAFKPNLAPVASSRYRNKYR